MEEKQLSFEHIPPQSAFNKRPVVMEILDTDMLEGKPSRKIHHQRGSGNYTLCGKCNTDTGAWYGNAFVDFAYQGMNLLNVTNESVLLHPFHVFPLRILKQVICMFLSVNIPSFCKTNSYLRKFVLSKSERYLPPDIRFFIYYAAGNRVRQSPLCSILHPLDNRPGSTFSEIIWPPFGYAMAVDNPPHPDMYCINHWSRYSYMCYKDEFLKLPILPIYGYMPGDYRSEKEIHGT